MGLIIDLRNNPGGASDGIGFDSAVKVADAFIDQGDIVVVKGRKPTSLKRIGATPGDGGDKHRADGDVAGQPGEDDAGGALGDSVLDGLHHPVGDRPPGDTAFHAQGRHARLQGHQSPRGSRVKAAPVGAAQEGSGRMCLQQLGRGIHGALQNGLGLVGGRQFDREGSQCRQAARILIRCREQMARRHVIGRRHVLPRPAGE